jgi:hypothetical protein
LFDLSELTMPTPKPRSQHDWMCAQCRRVTLSRVPCACGSTDFVIHLDRRPLLLDKETRNRIIDLIDEAANRVPEMLDVDDQLHITGEYMPFLSRLLDGAELAEERRRDYGSGFRRTALTTAELIALFREMKLPPTTE